MIVDDTPSFRRAVRGLLERRGYRVAGEADCAAAAIASVERLEPHAVLADVNLPDMDGFALTARLTGGRPGPAVLLTADDFEDGFYARARRCGASGFVPKSLLPRAELTRFWPSSPDGRARRGRR